MAQEKNTQKLTYEQLENAASALAEQNKKLLSDNQALIQRINELSSYAGFKRLEFLFRVIEIDNKIATFNTEFVGNCVKEIEETMTIPEVENTEETKEEQQ